MAQLNGLPVYNIKINEDLSHKTGIDFISLVDCPAIESNWVAMSSKKEPFKFALDKDKQILAGPILITDLPIYRNDNGIEYYVVFSAQEIEKLVRKFQASQKTINLNYQHQKDSQVSNAVIQEIWLTGKNDKSKDLGFNLPIGSAFVCAHIGDKTFWDEQVKTQTVKGFSIEGFLDMEMKKMNKTKIKLMATAKTNDGKSLKTPADAFAEGVEIMIVADDNTEMVCPDGDYVLESGETVSVAGGKVTKISEVEFTEEEVGVLAEALKKVLKPLEDQVAELKLKNTELETKLSNIPGAKSATDKTDETKPVKLSVTQLSKNKLGILRKKDAELKS